MTGTTPLFELKSASVLAGRRRLLDAVSLVIEPGRIVGLIGPNGSGKSTLMKLLARQLRPDEGEVEFRGRPIDGWPVREFARSVAHLPQFTPATDGMLVEELVALGRFPWHGTLGRFGDDDRLKVEAAIARAQIEPFRGRQVDTLSGGERQRVWLAMLLAQDAACLLLDEPTSALDIAHQIEVLSLVHALGREGGISVVLILHDINMAARFCDDIVALGSGRIVARGAASELMSADRLAEIYGVPLGIVVPPGLSHPVSYPL